MPGPNDKRNLHRRFTGKGAGNLISNHRRAWVSIRTLMTTFYHSTRVNNGDFSEIGPESKVILNDGKTQIVLQLTSWREDELTAFLRLITMACETARTVVRERDRVAYTALSEGSTKYPRCFRPQSNILIREGEEFDVPYLPREWGGESGQQLEVQTSALLSTPIGVFIDREEMVSGSTDPAPAGGQEAEE